MSTTHLTDEQLTQHAADSMRGTSDAAVEQHLGECSDCRARFEDVSAMLLSKTLAHPLSLPPVGPATRPDGPAAREEEKAIAISQGKQLGRYLLLERLGAGGMGEVFAAYDPQLDRKVALKLLRSGTLSASEGRARLLREAQAMARLQHPNVVAVHDVGTFEDRVFIAMEFVEGETLSTWLRGAHRWQDVLRIMLGAGSGLASAHKAGIVHRDFKPDNVLIGGDNRPRVVDFGLARQAISNTAHDADKKPPPPVDGPLDTGSTPRPDGSLDPLASPLTRDGAVMGTPGYMAPEQLAGLPTDARCDQFAFCVAMYEGLYGKRPFGGSTLKAHANEIAAGKLPPPPSSSDVPSYLYEALKRGLAADPAQRYPSMDALLEAIRPARPTSRRQLVAAIAALAVVAAGAIGFGIYSNQKLRVCGGLQKRMVGVWDAAAKARLKQAFNATGASFAGDAYKSVESALDAYSQSWVSAATDACEAARIRKADSEDIYERKQACLETRLKQVSALTAVLEGADREVVRQAPSAARRLDRIEECRDVETLKQRSFARDQKERAREEALLTRLIEARALHDAGRYAKGVEVAKAAIALGGPPHAMGEAFLLLGRLQVRAGEAKAAEATFFDAAVQAEESGDPALVARAYSRLSGTVGSIALRFDEAHQWEKLASGAATRVPSDPEVQAELLSNAGQVALAEQNADVALQKFKAALEVQEAALGPEHPEVGRTLNNEATALAKLDRFEDAANAYERSLELHVKTQGMEHPDTASSMHNLAVIYRHEGRLSEALTLFERSLKVRESTLGAEHPDVALSHLSLGNLQLRLDQPEPALEHLHRALQIREKAFGADSAQAAQVHDDLASVYLAQHAWKEAFGHAAVALQIDEKTAPKSAVTASAYELLGLTLVKLGQWDKATGAIQKSLELRREKFGPDHHEVARSYNALGDLLLAQNKPDKALPMYERALVLREKSQGPAKPAIATELVGIGRCQLSLKNVDRAVAVFERAVTMLEKSGEPTDLAIARFELARALWESSTSEHQRAVELASVARAQLKGDGRADADAWLTAHPLPDH